jgi:hypothetical protein
MAKQLNIFVQNEPGRLKIVAEKLTHSGINIRAFTLQDRGEYGLLKLIVNDPGQAYLAMADSGCACALKDVLAVSIPDKSGNFHTLVSALADNKINIIDAYGFVVQPGSTGVCCVELAAGALPNARQVAEKAGFVILEDKELYNI